MSEVTILFSDEDKKNLEKYMEMTRGGKWNIHDDFDIKRACKPTEESPISPSSSA